MPSLLALPGTPMAGTPTGVRVGVAPARRLFSRSGTAGDLSVGVPRHDTKKPHGAGGPAGTKRCERLPRVDSNHQPPGPEPDALPIELLGKRSAELNLRQYTE